MEGGRERENGAMVERRLVTCRFLVLRCTIKKNQFVAFWADARIVTARGRAHGIFVFLNTEATSAVTMRASAVLLAAALLLAACMSADGFSAGGLSAAGAARSATAGVCRSLLLQVCLVHWTSNVCDAILRRRRRMVDAP